MRFIFNWLGWNVFLNKTRFGVKFRTCAAFGGVAENVEAKYVSSVCCADGFFWGFRMERFPFSFPSDHFSLLVFFDCAFFLRCSHVTSVRSPCVLNSNVFNASKILLEPLCKKRKRKKKKGKCGIDRVMVISSGVHCCIQHSVTDTWCQHWGCFMNICKYRLVG